MLDVPPTLTYPNGYSGRYHHFLQALNKTTDMTILGVGQAIAESDVPFKMQIIDLPDDNPLLAPGLTGKMRRLHHYLGKDLPFMSYPRLSPRNIEDAVQGADVVIGFLPNLAHLLLHVPEHIPTVAVLEEGWEKAMEWGSKDTPRLRRAFAKASEGRKVRELQRRIGRRAARVVVISPDEIDWFSRVIPREKLHVIPHGIDTGHYRPRATSTPEIDVGVVGILAGGANVDGIMDFLQPWLHRPRDARPSVVLVGRSPNQDILRLSEEGVLVKGDVADVRPWYERAKVIVVPATYGAGAKTTVLQGWAMKKPLVATRFSMNSLPARPGENVAIADSPGELWPLIDQLLDSEEQRERLSREGRRTVEEERNMQKLGSEFATSIIELCA